MATVAASAVSQMTVARGRPSVVISPSYVTRAGIPDVGRASRMLRVAMEIRLIRAKESETLGRITVEAYRQLFDTESLGPYEEELANVEARRLDSEVFVAVTDGEVRGGVTYVPDSKRAMSEFDDEGAAGIRMLAVAPTYQGHGAGRALIEKCVERARTDRRERLTLHSTSVMEVAQAMYVKMGFVQVPELDIHYGGEPYSEDDPLHLIAYTLTL